jgi:hypothetical protein
MTLAEAIKLNEERKLKQLEERKKHNEQVKQTYKLTK